MTEEGNPESEELKKERRKSVGGPGGNPLSRYYSPPEYIDSQVYTPHRKVKKRIRFSKDVGTRIHDQLQPKHSVKRHKVSLTHFPRGLTTREEEVPLIKRQNTGRGSPERHRMRNARRIHAPGHYKNRRDWPRYSPEIDGPVPNTYDSCCKSCLTEDLTPGTYMVQVEPESEDDCDEGDGTCTIERRQPTCTKCYYLFERMPFKVKFLNYVPSPFEDYIPPRPVMMPSLNEVSVKLTMPPFQCIPPECREVLYCKYFQCTSLGFFPDSRNCRKYFFCDLNSSGFVLYHMLCPKGRIFDPVLRECRLKELMDKREVQRCRMEAAKMRRNEKMRIKKNDYDDLIKYKRRNTVGYASDGRWRRRRIPGEDGRQNATVRGRNMTYQPDGYTWHIPKYRRKKTWANFTIPKYCEMFLTMTTTSTTETTITTTVETTTTEVPTTTTTTTTTTSTTPKTTLCSPAARANKTSKNYLGDLDSDTYQEDMQDYEYDGYYDGDYGTEKAPPLHGDYEWLRQGLTEYLDKVKFQKGNATHKESTKPTTLAQEKDEIQQEKELPTLAVEQTEIPLLNDPEREKREKSSTSTAATVITDSSIIGENLPEFEKIYKEQISKNLDGYPCKEYARYPDKFDNVCYYECGAQPDGGMRVEHKCCPKGEEFSPQYLECVATEYLKMTHRKRSASKQSKSSKKPLPDPEDNYEDDKEMPNEWLDASHTNKVPNEFKSKTKNTLRIFHLHCRRNSSEDPYDHKRNFTVRESKKEDEEEEDDEDDEYDDEEEYEDDSEISTVGTRSSSETTALTETSQTTSKVLLDADIHVGRDFESALRNILGKGTEQEKNQKRDSKDSILIRLQAPKSPGRRKRNFLKGIFSKKNKNNGDYPDKESVVSMLTLINGLPSEYERDVLLQKLEKRKMLNSHLFRSRQAKRKRQKSQESTSGNDVILREPQQ